MNDAPRTPRPADDFDRVVRTALLVGEGRTILAMYDDGRDCAATVESLRGIVDRLEAIVRSSWQA
jgi:hypothetical protein